MFYFARTRFRCGLYARLLATLLLFLPLTGACSPTTERDEPEESLAENELRAERPDTLSVPKPRNAIPVSIDLLGNPFIADRLQGQKLEAYFARINADFTVDADPISNIHASTVTDTLFTIRFGDSVLELYAPTQTGDLLLQDADIRNTGITLRNNMKVGMTQPELMAKLRNHDVRILQTLDEIVATSRDGAPIALRFYLKNGKVNRIRYEGYLD